MCSCRLQSKAEIYCNLPPCMDCHVSVLPEFVFQLLNVQNKVFKKALPLLTGTNSDERSRPTNFLEEQQKPTLRVFLSANTAPAFQGP